MLLILLQSRMLIAVFASTDLATLSDISGGSGYDGYMALWQLSQ